VYLGFALYRGEQGKQRQHVDGEGDRADQIDTAPEPGDHPAIGRKPRNAASHDDHRQHEAQISQIIEPLTALEDTGLDGPVGLFRNRLSENEIGCDEQANAKRCVEGGLQEPCRRFPCPPRPLVDLNNQPKRRQGQQCPQISARHGEPYRDYCRRPAEELAATRNDGRHLAASRPTPVRTRQ
jgi:hypothetical protein